MAKWSAHFQLGFLHLCVILHWILDLKLLSQSPNVLLLPQRFIPESVRWLLVKGKKEKAREILSNVAKVNKKEMPSEELRVPVTTASKGIFELFKTWNMAKLSLIQCYAWLVMNKASSLNVSSSHPPPPPFNPKVWRRVLRVGIPTPPPSPLQP